MLLAVGAVEAGPAGHVRGERVRARPGGRARAPNYAGKETR
ncbi:hypothetical protein ACH4C2_35000 [Streptomyces sp. NPDC018057]